MSRASRLVRLRQVDWDYQDRLTGRVERYEYQSPRRRRGRRAHPDETSIVLLAFLLLVVLGIIMGPSWRFGML